MVYLIALEKGRQGVEPPTKIFVGAFVRMRANFAATPPAFSRMRLLRKEQGMLKVAPDLAIIREIIAQHGSLSVDVASLDLASNLYDAGLTSLATVGVMLALEDHFN